MKNLKIVDEVTVFEESRKYFGLSSKLPDGSHIGIFDYDDYPHSGQQIPRLILDEPLLNIYKLFNYIWIRTSRPNNYQLILPFKFNITQLKDVFFALRPYPCPLNFANGLRKEEWVSRIMPKMEKGKESRIKVIKIDISKSRKTDMELDWNVIDLYRMIAQKKPIKKISGLTFVEYSRYDQVGFTYDIKEREKESDSLQSPQIDGKRGELHGHSKAASCEPKNP